MPKTVNFTAEIVEPENVEFPTRVIGVPDEYLEALESGSVLVFEVNMRTVRGRFVRYAARFAPRKLQVATKDGKTYVRLVAATEAPVPRKSRKPKTE